MYGFMLVAYLILTFVKLLMQRPVDFNKLLSKQVLPLERPSKTPIIISVAQFRPEKVGILVLSL
jgi:hypothetical protein